MNTSKLSLGDRYAEISVIVVTLVALLAGWLYMGSVQSRALPFEAEGLKASVPAGWIQSEPGGEVLMQVRQRASAGFQTEYTVTQQPLTADSGMNEVVSLLTIRYGQELMGFRVLSQQAVTVNGRDAYEISYAYVEADPNVSHLDLPVVVRGLDYIFLNGEQAVIATYRASEAEYQGGLAAFLRFLHSLQF
jgi:hypothetical protein